jgi:hypothetical protein
MEIQQIVDREAIREILFRYCRGVDRKDRAKLEQVYWPDAIDDHVHVTLSGPAYVDHVLRATGEMRTAHHLTNILIEFDTTSSARCETYFLGLHEMPGDDGAIEFVLISGRYLDRFEKRGEEWRIGHRALVFDMQQTHPVGLWDGWLAKIARRGAPFPNDPLYSLIPGPGA